MTGAPIPPGADAVVMVERLSECEFVVSTIPTSLARPGIASSAA